MILTDKLKTFDDKIKPNQAQYRDREAVKISALSSKELDKYVYVTGEYLRYKLGVGERAKFEYSRLGEVLSGIVKKDKQSNKTYKIVRKDKQNKHLVYNQRHSFAKIKDISVFKELSLDSMHKRLNDFL